MPLNRRPEPTDKIAVLRDTELFGSLTDDVLKKIAGCAATRQLSRGRVLVSENDEASGLYVVTRGEIRSTRQNIGGREQVLSTERAGAVLAAVPVFNGGKFYSTLIADTKAEVLYIEKNQVHELCREHTELLWNLARVLGHIVRHHAELIETLALRNVEQRVAQHLLAVARERGVPIGDGCVFELTLTRTEIASRIGSTREVVSRALTHLHKSGLIQMEGRRLVTIPNMRALIASESAEQKLEKPKLISELSSEIV